MILKTFPISLDVNSSTIRKTNIELVKNDTSVYNFLISMYDGSTLLDLTTACSTSTISFLKADSNVVVGGTTKTTGGLLSYSLGTNEIAFEGRVKATVELFGGTGSRISSNQFEFNVRDDIGTGIASTTAYPILTDLITIVEGLVSGLDPNCVVVTNASGVVVALTSGATGQYVSMSTGATSVVWADSPQSLFTARGDLLYATAANSLGKLSLGSTGQMLIVASGATGLSWSESPQTLFSSRGDILYATSANSLSKLSMGTTGRMLGVASGATGLIYMDSPQSLLTTYGDLLYATGANDPARLAKGASGQCLGISTGATSIQWMPSPRSILTTQGDLLYATGANDPARLAKGTTGQYLGMSTGATAPLYRAVSADTVTISDLGSYFTGTDVESALQEIATAMNVALYSTSTTVTQQVILLPSTVVKGALNTCTLQGETFNNILINKGDCGTLADFTRVNCTGALSTTHTLFGTSALQLTLEATSGYAYIPVTSSLISGNYYLISAYGKVATAITVSLQFESDDQDVIATAVSSTTYSRMGIVIAPTDYDTATTASIRLLVTGATGNIAYFDGIMMNTITSAEYLLGATALMAKYNFINSTKSTNSVKLKSVGENKIRNGNGEEGLSFYNSGFINGSTGVFVAHGTLSIGNDGSIQTVITTGTNGVAYNTFIPISTTTKTLRVTAKISSGTFTVLPRYYDSVFNFIGTQSATYSSAADYTIKDTILTIPANATYLKYQVICDSASTINVKEMSLIEGSTALATYKSYSESVAYIPVSLTSVGSIKDDVNVIAGQKIQKININSLSNTSYDSLDNSTYTNVDIIKTTVVTGAKIGTTGIDGYVTYFNNAGTQLVEVNATSIDYASSVNKFYWTPTGCLWLIATADTHGSIASARTSLATSTLYYQLTTPIPTNLLPQKLIAYPSGTIIIENIVQDFDFYNSNNNGINITNTTLPIKTLDSVCIINKITGEETPISISACTVATGGLSFTTTSTTNGNLIWFTYNYESSLSSIPSFAYSYNMNISATVSNNVDAINNISKELNEITTMISVNLGDGWNNWTPSLSWTGTPPASITGVYTYKIIGKTVFFDVYITSADGNDATNLTVSLPISCKNNSKLISISGQELVDSTWANKIAYIDESTSLIGFRDFATATDTKTVTILCNGRYEIS